MRAADAEGVAGVALWRLGYEDPGVWAAFGAFESKKIPDLTTLQAVYNVDVEGNGELLRITDTPTLGSRTITGDRFGLIRGEQYQTLPTPYVVTRVGYRPGLLALTFDDGPDGYWTPRVLDILKREGVPGTFFVIGENAVSHPELLNREIDEGSEIGNHSYTHPNMALASLRGTSIELNATQRLIEAYTGRGTRLLRLPYFGDAEPTTDDELVPALRAQNDGYLNVGLHVDSEDWTRPGAAAIVKNTLEGVYDGDAEKSGNVILLHDAGGDRQQTLDALPTIIETLKAKGYKFVTVSQLVGLTRGQVMPTISGKDLLAVRADVGMFLVLAGLLAALKWLFFVAIGLGIARAVLLAILALFATYEQSKEPVPEIDPKRFVSVLIPAFNEARVIESSIRRVLASEAVEIEVIVIDDGSTDGTSALVEASFAGDERVRVLTLENGGKAVALNRGMTMARGEVIVALDADTQFEVTTIARLARWFVDPEIGAVAGNAKVGNRVNLVTRWQAIEYVTAQNLERRALTRFDAITVVPGAVGAWRQGRARRGRRLSGRHARRGPGSHHRDPARRLGGRLRRRGGGVDRGARDLPRARQAALPLGVRHAAMPVEAPRDPARAQTRGARAGRHPAGVGVPDRVRGDLADHRSRARDQHRGDLHPRPPAWLGADAERRAAHGRLLARLHLDRPGLRLDRVSAGAAAPALPGVPAARAALRLSPADVFGGAARGLGGAVGAVGWLGQAGPHRLGQRGSAILNILPGGGGGPLAQRGVEGWTTVNVRCLRLRLDTPPPPAAPAVPLP